MELWGMSESQKSIAVIDEVIEEFLQNYFTFCRASGQDNKKTTLLE